VRSTILLAHPRLALHREQSGVCSRHGMFLADLNDLAVRPVLSKCRVGEDLLKHCMDTLEKIAPLRTRTQARATAGALGGGPRLGAGRGAGS